MGTPVFMQGNIALVESAIRAGCRFYFGYPITPASEMSEYFSAQMRDRDVTFVQAETEVAAFNMIAGVAAGGQRGMTGTSGPGLSLGAEAMSFMAAAGLPTVVVDVMRPGPGDGEILAAQGDYFQACKGNGHGDYNVLVLAPWSVQEEADLAYEAFDLAEKYLNPVILLTDASLGKMRESCVLPEPKDIPKVTWKGAMTGSDEGGKKVITTCGDGADQYEAFNLTLQKKFAKIAAAEQRWESTNCEDADIVIVAYGSVARIAMGAMELARDAGMKVGLIRPISLWPFPKKAFERLDGKQFAVFELSAGQMVEDVMLSVKNKDDVHFYGRMGGNQPTPAELFGQLTKIAGGGR
ncbi:2-oxoglutarate oxidoreductase subunit KorA [bioreactor metagenome]|uniref:2-oxoglutarate oxidoreductase subunit KorA n=1 Tax=bioreactor metagenome TaxID=1076179 RepID=A0A644XR24_9ZZZZ